MKEVKSLKLFREVGLVGFLLLSSFNTYCAFLKMPKNENVVFSLSSDIDQELGPSSIDPARIEILVWNIFKGRKDGLNNDLAEMTKGKDIALLQEVVSSPSMLESLKENFNHLSLVTSFFKNDSNNTRNGVAVASKIKPITTFWARSPHREPIINTPKMVSFSVFDLEGFEENLLVINIHAINFVNKRKFELMIKQVFYTIKNHVGPVIFAGDFNTWSRRKKVALLRYVKDHGLVEVSFRNDERMKMFGQTLDYVFVKDLKVKDAFVHGEIESSDHKAMEVSLSYEGN